MARFRRVRRKPLDWWARKEPHIEMTRVPRGVVPAMRSVVLSEWQKRRKSWIIYITIISLLVHILIVFLIIRFVGREEPMTFEPIPIQLVMLPAQDANAPPKPKQPEPKKPPPPEKQQQGQKPPPPGPLASDEFGDPDATGKTPAATHAPEAGTPMANAGEAPPPPADSPAAAKPNEVARPKPDQANDPSAAPKEETPDTPNKLALGGVLAPPPKEENKPKTEQLAAKPVDKPSQVKLLRVHPGGATNPNEHPDDPEHDSGHKAKYPGPDASRDEYLAYIRELTMAQIDRLPPSLFAGKHGIAIFELLIRPNGSIVWFSSVQSSGDREADQALLSTLNNIGSFPPLPAELLTRDNTPARLTFSLPLALVGTNR